MSKKLLVLFALLVYGTISMAQLPPPCDPSTVEPAENCPSACINCNFNGYVGTTAGWAGDAQPMGWCSNIQNDQWLGFIAGGTSATFTITPGNCSQGQGVQAAVYPAGCNDNPLECNPGCATCGSTPTVFSVSNMIVGSNYYLIIDGYSQDQCDFTISVAPPSAVQAPNVANTPQISGPSTICPGGSGTYSIANVNGAGFYTWESNNPNVLFNGVPGPVDLEAPGGRTVTVTFPSGMPNGTQISICVTPVNSCNTGTQRCKTVTLQNLAPTTLPKQVVCAEDAPYILPWEDEVNTTNNTFQNFTHTYTTALGCDSLVQQMVRVLQPLASTQTKYVCKNNCVTICGVEYCDQGQHQETCDSYQGCDSTITLNLNVLDPIAVITGPTTLSCSTTCITLGSAASPNSPGVSIKSWRNMAGGPATAGETLQVCQAGTYILTTTMTAGQIQCSQSDTVVVTGNTIPPNATGVNGYIGCGAGPAQISVTTNAANPLFQWSGCGGFSSTSQSPFVTQGCTYTVTVTDQVTGCTATATSNVTGDITPPVVSASNAVITCASPSVISTASSNVPSNYVWSNSTTGANNTITAAGTYVVTVTSTLNNCTATAVANITENTTLPGATAAVTGTIGCPTPAIPLTSSSPTAGVTYSWGGPGVVGSGQNVSANLSGVYTVTVTNPTNGCISTASTTVNGNVNVPNASAVGITLDCNVPNDTIFANSTTSGVTYSWNTGVTTRFAQVNTPGTYTVTVTATNGCTETATAVVDGDFAAPNATATGGTISCTANTIQISGSSTTPGVTYNWIGPGGNPHPGQTITVSNVGNYTLTVQAPNGCTTTAIATVAPDANVPNIATVGDTITCLQTSANISGSSTTPGVTYMWSSSTGGITPGTETNPNLTVTVNGLYNLAITNPANGCTAYGSAFVALNNNNPNLVASGDTLTCTLPSVQLFSNSTTPGVTYLWSNGANIATPSVTMAGTYTVTVTAPNGCTTSAQAIIEADQNIPVLSTAANTLTCTTQSVVINTTSSISTVTYDWAGISSQAQNPTVNLPGTYTVTATAPNGCTASASITVNQDIAPPNASATGGTLTCTTPTLNLSGTSTTPGATFLWPALNSTIQNPTVSSPSVYSLVVTGPNGCKTTVTAPVDANQEVPVIQVGVPSILDCDDLTSVLQTNILTNMSSVQTIAWSNGDTTEDPSVSAPGNYTVTVTLANGCSSTATTVVDQDIAVPNAAATGGILDCVTPQLNLESTSTTPGATFTWSNGLPAVSNPSVNADGSYTVTVTGPNACTSTAVAVVSIDTIAPGAAIVSSNVINCTDETATLSASTTTGISYSWSGFGIAPGTTTSTVSVDAASDYTVITTGANGCTSQAVFSQTDDLTPPDANGTGGTLDCFTSNTQLIATSATAGASFQWTNPSGATIPGQNPTVNQSGTYTLVVTGPNGCTQSTTAVVMANTSSPNAELTGNGLLTCATTAIDLTGSTTTPNTTIEWTFPDGTTSTSNQIAADQPGVYSFTVTSNDNGCITTQTLNLGQNIIAPGNLTASSPIIDCDNPTITLQGGSDVPDATYEWTGPGGVYTEQNPMITTAGTYVLVVTDPFNGCTASITEEVVADQNFPTLTAATEIITCKTPVVTLDATSNVVNGSYTWTGPNQFTSTLQDPTTGAPGSYTVVVKDPVNGCTATFTFEANEDKVAPNISVQNGQITCAQPSIDLDGSSTTQDVSYLWTAPSGTTYNTPNPTVSQPGDYTLVVTNNVNGCTSSAVANVAPDQNIPVVTVTGGLITCTNPDVDLTGAANKPDVTWSWSGPGGYSSTDQNPTIDAPGTYTLIVTTPINGCTGQASVVVNADIVPPSVNIATPDKLDCTTTQVALTATVNAAGNYTYSWTTAGGNFLSGETSATPTVSLAAPYTVLVTNTANGCTSTRTINVEVDPAVPTAIANTPRAVSCFGYTNGAVTIDGVTGGTAPYLFSVDNQPFIAASAFNALPPGVHNLRVQDANGCELETTFVVNEPAELLVNLGPDTTISLGDAIAISLNNTVNYPDRVAGTVVSPSSLDSLLFCATCTGTFEPTYSLQYRVAVVDSNGCRADDIRMIIVDRTRHIFVPNVFEPNGAGGTNNLLTVFGGNDVKQIKSFRIYDRWGESVHEAFNFLPGDLNVAWDGKINGKPANPAVFVYSLQVLFKDGETELFTGDVTIVRQ